MSIRFCKHRSAICRASAGSRATTCLHDNKTIDLLVSYQYKASAERLLYSYCIVITHLCSLNAFFFFQMEDCAKCRFPQVFYSKAWLLSRSLADVQPSGYLCKTAYT